MFRVIVAVMVLGMAGAASAQSTAGAAPAQGTAEASMPGVRKPCEELKGEIDAKIKKNGVEKFTLDIVDKDAQADGKVVGTCDGQTKKIVYKRG